MRALQQVSAQQANADPDGARIYMSAGWLYCISGPTAMEREVLKAALDWYNAYTSTVENDEQYRDARLELYTKVGQLLKEKE
jgi:hypothetical protein